MDASEPRPLLAVRPFEETDRPALVALWRRCKLTVPHNDPDLDIDRAWAKPNSEVLVGVLDGRPAASAMVGHDGHRGWIYYVAVDPDLQGGGLGRQIMAAAEAWLRARGAPKAQLMIRDTNTTVRAFYEAIGWEAIPRTVMEKWL